MINQLDEHTPHKYLPDALINLRDERANLGEDIPVYVYRMLQFSLRDVITEEFGKEVMIDIYRKAGRVAGNKFANECLDLELPTTQFISHLQTVLEEYKIGILRVEKFKEKTGLATLTLAEDADCSGLPFTGETACNYDEGFLAGVLTTYTKKDYIVTEIDCWATGSRICRFDAKVKKETAGKKL